MIKTARLIFFGALVHACLLSTSALAAPTIAQADAVARKSLELKQYSSVVEAYRELDPLLLNDQALYRLAIAQQKLDNPIEAQKALSLALEKNPKGSFASSQERLATLKDEIVKGIAQKTVSPKPMVMDPVVNASALPPLPGAANDSKAADSSVVVSPVAASQDKPVTDSPVKPAVNVGAPSSAVVQITKSVEASGSEFRLDVTAALVLLGGVLVLAICIGNKWSPFAKPAPSNIAELVALRDSVKKTKLLIEMAGNTSTELYKALEKLEPVVIKEIGRIAYRASRDENLLVRTDQQLLQSLSTLQSAPMLLAGADPEQVMDYIFCGQARSKLSLAVGSTAF